ncbi:MAG TPA: ABC transporter ATP-binding protein [Acidimicrobiales bacterium]
MSDPLVLADIVMSYPDGPSRRVVLDHLDLRLGAGELVVISGESGTGKSTLLTVAGLLRRPDEGEVTVAGTRASGLSERKRTALRRAHIAFVYQSANLLPSLTATEQLQLVGHIRGERVSSTRDRARRLLGDLGLGDRLDQLPHQLSGGERQRVGIGRALMASPDVLIADEPTASLDPRLATSVIDLLADAARDRGIATLVVAHDDGYRRRADRHLHLDAGKLTEVSVAD